MTDQKDLSQPLQPEGTVDITQGGRVERPRRRFGTVVNYPDSPITIPPDRREAAREALTVTNELWEQGRHYDSLTTWFGYPVQLRDDVIDSTLLQESKPTGRSLRSAQDDTKGKPEHLILKHYALFATPAVAKIILPTEDNPIEEADVRALMANPSDDGVFYGKLRSLGLKQGYSPFDYADFKEPNSEMLTTFTLEEAREFLVKLIPHINDGDVRRQLLSTWGVVNGVKWADLLTDPRLADDLERPMLGEISWSSHIEQFLSQEVYPSAAFFEEAFKRLKPEDSDPQATYEPTREGSIRLPLSALYFNLLRRIIPLESIREKHPEFGRGREEAVISYLLSDTFMSHVAPYLDIDEAYGDDLIQGISGTMFRNTEIKAIGGEARTLKRKMLGEVIQTAIGYAQQTGDAEAAEKLSARKLGEISFADLLQK